MYWTLSCAVWLAGPFTVQAMIGLLLRVSDRIHLISNGIVQGIESDSLNKVRIAWAQKSGSR